MSDFLVLGLIPGTPIQITFLLWIIGVAAVFVLGSVWLGRRTRPLRNWIITTMVVMAMRHQPHNQNI